MNNARRTWFLGYALADPRWPGPLGADEVKCTILQFNDVYEILSPRGNDGGSLARVAAIRDKLRQENPNTITMLAGDFFSPSPMMDAIDPTSGDKRLAGRQMVAVLNEFRLDLATFGNHEFDLKAAEFFDRMRECRFGWVSSNVSDQTGNPFVGVPRHKVLRFVNERGTTVRIGVISVTSDSEEDRLRELRQPHRGGSRGGGRAERSLRGPDRTDPLEGRPRTRPWPPRCPRST